MKAEVRKSEDQLLVQAIHKTMGQMEQLKQACLQLSVNADAELALFMRETERLLERVQPAVQEAERHETERAVHASAMIKKAIRPAAAYVSGRKLVYSPGKSGRFTGGCYIADHTVRCMGIKISGNTATCQQQILTVQRNQ